jgi:hypothetical protein
VFFGGCGEADRFERRRGEAVAGEATTRQQRGEEEEEEEEDPEGR